MRGEGRDLALVRHVKYQMQTCSCKIASSLLEITVTVVAVLLVSAVSGRRDAAAVAGVCPRWSCPCVTPAHNTNKRLDDDTSHYRRTAFSAAREALLLTQSILHRIVSHLLAHIILQTARASVQHRIGILYIDLIFNYLQFISIQ